jgi:phosphoglycerol transferase MdoB-like AlkP superfamily enzyme
MASVFNKKGYESKFLYGGYGYFDNMNYFFENNNYQVFDRRNLESEDITFENVWGVSDEDLYDLTLREIGNTVQKGKASFVHVMTTSNHRPFTYPGDRIDIPSGAGRAGAVKYTDYAIGRFLKAASAQPWYLNTVFIITADHCASSAGKTDLPVDKYQIPMLIFSPSGAIAAGEQSRLMSQIDIAPTLLGFLNFSYDSKFFGYDLNALPPGKERAFISTYQKLGYLKNDSLVILSPKKAPEIFTEENQVWSRQTLSPDVGNPLQITTEAITWYETSSFAFRHGKLNTKL